MADDWDQVMADGECSTGDEATGQGKPGVSAIPKCKPKGKSRGQTAKEKRDTAASSTSKESRQKKAGFAVTCAKTNKSNSKFALSTSHWWKQQVPT